MDRKLVTIIGAGPGIGASVSSRFAKEGYRVALVSRNEEKLAAIVQSLKDQNMDVFGVQADSGNFESLLAAFEQILNKGGETEILVYNAAVLKPALPSQLGPSRLVEEFRTNVAGALHSVQLVLTSMKERKKGTIILTGGGLALDPYPQYASLAIGKAGIRNLTFSLAAELQPQGIHVATVTICGLVKMGTHFDPDTIAEKFWMLHQQPVGSWEREIIYR